MPTEEVVVAAEPPAAEIVDAMHPAAAAVAGASASAPEVSNCPKRDQTLTVGCKIRE